MDSVELKDYIERVKNLEVSCYRQAQYIEGLNNVLEKVQHPSIYTEVKTKGEEPTGIFVSIWTGILELVATLIAGVVIDVFIYLILCILVVCLWLLNLIFKAAWISAILDWDPPMWLCMVVLGAPILLCLVTRNTSILFFNYHEHTRQKKV